MTRILRPSCFNTRANAAKRLSSPTSLWTYFAKKVLHAMNEANDPATLASAATNQPLGNPYKNPAMVRDVE